MIKISAALAMLVIALALQAHAEDTTKKPASPYLTPEMFDGTLIEQQVPPNLAPPLTFEERWQPVEEMIARQRHQSPVITKANPAEKSK